MKTFGTFLGVIFGLAVFVAILVGGYFLFKYIADVFNTLGPQVETIVVIGTVVALLCAMIIAGGLKTSASSGSATAQTANVYQRLAAFWTDQLTHDKLPTGELPDSSEIGELERNLVLYGSPKVISAHMDLRKAMREGDKEEGKPLVRVRKLVSAMRADLGRKDMNIKEKDLLALLLGRES